MDKVTGDAVRISDLLVMIVDYSVVRCLWLDQVKRMDAFALRIDSPSSLHGMQGRQPEGSWGRGASTASTAV